jgi:hypothetical protein
MLVDGGCCWLMLVDVGWGWLMLVDVGWCVTDVKPRMFLEKVVKDNDLTVQDLLIIVSLTNFLRNAAAPGTPWVSAESVAAAQSLGDH